VCGPTTGAPSAVDQEHLSEKLVSAESVLELLLLKANFPASPSHPGKPADSNYYYLMSVIEYQLILRRITNGN